MAHLWPIKSITNKVWSVIKPRWPVVLILAGTWVVFFSRTLIGQAVYYLDDLKIIYYPLETVYAQFQNNFSLPLWSQYFGFGQPLLAWGQLGFFTPLHVMLRLLHLHPLTLLQVSILVYFALGLMGMYLFLSNCRLTSAAAAMAAIIFTFAGWHVAHLNHVNFYTTTMLLPWLLLCLRRLAFFPSLTRALLVTLVAAAMAVSGQPQIILYSFIIAAIWFSLIFWSSRFRCKLAAYILLAGVLAACLAAIAILPLSEFLPSTDRAFGLSKVELLEFSYPPHHVLTLLWPYFFGDHYYYWGAKSFQELAAYTGIIPLLLLAGSLPRWRARASLFIFAVILVALGILGALGSYSPVYTWLVEHNIIKSIAIPGRFVYFFVVGTAILSAVGLDNLRHRSINTKLAALVVGLVWLSLLFYPALLYLRGHRYVYSHWLSLLTSARAESGLLLLAVLVYLAFIFTPAKYTTKLHLPSWLVVLTSVTLVVYGWNYNPLTAKAVAYQQPALAATLAQYNQQHQFPARVYQVEHESISAQRRTEPISNSLTVYQPVSDNVNQESCFSVPFKLTDNITGPQDDLIVSLNSGLTAVPLATTTIKPAELSGRKFDACFAAMSGQSNQPLYLSFRSQGNSGVHLIYQPTDVVSSQAYLFRVADPTPVQRERSRKPLAILYETRGSQVIDLETKKLVRHLNVTAGASSPNWIGALGIGNYKLFTTTLLADDSSPTNYNSNELVQSHRPIMDLAGVTHVIENALVGTSYDHLRQAGFEYITTAHYGKNVIRLHANPTTYPKAWLGEKAVFSPVARETIAKMKSADFNPRALIYLSGPTPPRQLTAAQPTPLNGWAKVIKYEPTEVDVQVKTNKLAWLVLGDSTTPQWQTYIDGEIAPQYTAFAVFRAAQVPAGRHLVSFRYQSPATVLAKRLSSTSFLVVIILASVAITRRVHPSPLI